jgi:hypothetical protein
LEALATVGPTTQFLVIYPLHLLRYIFKEKKKVVGHGGTSTKTKLRKAAKLLLDNKATPKSKQMASPIMQKVLPNPRGLLSSQILQKVFHQIFSTKINLVLTIRMRYLV